MSKLFSLIVFTTELIHLKALSQVCCVTVSNANEAELCAVLCAQTSTKQRRRPVCGSQRECGGKLATLIANVSLTKVPCCAAAFRRDSFQRRVAAARRSPPAADTVKD